MKRIFNSLFLILFLFQITNAQTDIYNPTKAEDIKSSLSDFGKMWTFDDIPTEKWKEQYGFEPTTQWLENVQKSALQFSSYCSAAFVSPNGLIMTNHHCGRGVMLKVQKENEDLLENGFYAETLKDERKIPNLYVDQLVLIEDVTQRVLEAIHNTSTKEQIEAGRKEIKKIEEEYKDETGLVCNVVKLYNGGKYSLYGYKRYDDIRLVMAPEFQIASTGWDWDNFTYPRYELDFMFFRAYEDNQPVATEHFFKWSPEGAEEDEPIFVIGRPGNTDRLLSYAQLEFFRDYAYKINLKKLNGLYNVSYTMLQKYPEKETEMLNSVMSIGNSRKVYAGMLLSLNNNLLMAKKKDFEKMLIEKIKSDENLNKKYGHIHKGLENCFKELSTIYKKNFAYNTFGWGTPKYFNFAQRIITIANKLKASEQTEEEFNKAMSNIINKNFDKEAEDLLLEAHTNLELTLLDKEDPIITEIYKSLPTKEATKYLLENSLITSKEKILELAKKTPDEILTCNDPFIKFIKLTQKDFKKLSKQAREVYSTISVLNQLLGELIFEIYGDKISPDATSTIRISDGVIKGYKYNGTLAPAKTTYYGMYDRYTSFGKKTYPWGLPTKWTNVNRELNLGTPLNIASTNDIVGGNSGSSIINRNMEVVGLVFDGNLESLAGSFLYLPEKNRSVAVDSKGLLEALKHIYKVNRIVDELTSSTTSE